MLSPRNTLVVLDLIETGPKTVGKFLVPDGGGLYSEAIVIAVGPGTVSATGGVPETHDLKPGQRVLVKAKEQRGDPARIPPILAGIRIQDGDRFLFVFEQLSIIGVISEPSSN